MDLRLLALMLSCVLWLEANFVKVKGYQVNEDCNTCCHLGSPEDIPKIPSTAVTPDVESDNRLCGSIGDCCSKYVKGDKGDAGVSGLPGRDGLSIKGDKGDSGISVKGDKGDSSVPVTIISPCREIKDKSAFSVIKTTSQNGNIGDVLTFDEVAANINHHFDLATNKFTCHIAGTYFFTFTIGVLSNIDIVISLVKNGHVILSAHSRSNFDINYNQVTNSVILNLVPEDKIWLQYSVWNGRFVHSDHNKYSSFTGFLLYEY